MLCKQFEELRQDQKTELIGKLNHLVQTYEWAFNMAKFMVERSELEGLFEGVDILPVNNPLIENHNQQLKNEIDA